MDTVQKATEFVRYLLEQLCDNKSDIVVEANSDDRGVLISITVNSDDMGRVIGKSGQTIDSIRLLVKTIGARGDQRINLKVLEPVGRDDSSSETGVDF